MNIKHLNRRVVLFLLLFSFFVVFLAYFFYSRSKAGSIWNDKEYIESLRSASQHTQLAGTPLPTPIQQENTPIDSFIRFVQSIYNYFNSPQ